MKEVPNIEGTHERPPCFMDEHHNEGGEVSRDRQCLGFGAPRLPKLQTK